MTNVQVNQTVPTITVQIGLANTQVTAQSEEGDTLLDVLKAALGNLPGAGDAVLDGTTINGQTVIFGGVNGNRRGTPEGIVRPGETVIVSAVKPNG